MGHAEKTLEDIPFPVVDASALTRDSVKLAVQVNGKLRATIEVAVTTPKDEIERLAKAEPNVEKHIEAMTVKKIIIVPGKIVNIVVG